MSMVRGLGWLPAPLLVLAGIGALVPSLPDDVTLFAIKLATLVACLGGGLLLYRSTRRSRRDASQTVG
jgi:hypothetical protein